MEPTHVETICLPCAVLCACPGLAYSVALVSEAPSQTVQGYKRCPVPALPDILLYLHALAPRIVGCRVERVRLVTPFLLRSVEPPLTAAEG